ncbi:MAG TPA: DUF1360 domain-containing protein [Acidimicrobiia bacterium]|nr:DUF1360 domain-containing protein [Acidimicrobiia bacterium]
MSSALNQDRQTQEEQGRARSLVEEYAPGGDRPLAGYAALMGLYGAAVTAGAIALKRRGRPLPEVRPVDILLVGVATHKLARRVSKDSVTSPLRAPFTRYEGVAGPAELKEQVRGAGFRKAIGELITCPFCLSQWVSTGFTFGLLTAPRATRWTASVFTSLALADFLQFAYAWAEQRSQR